MEIRLITTNGLLHVLHFESAKLQLLQLSVGKGLESTIVAVYLLKHFEILLKILMDEAVGTVDI